jgi:hypothetical protein
MFMYFEGECGTNTGGRLAYYNVKTQMFLYYQAHLNLWSVSIGCGMEFGNVAYSPVGWSPSEDIAATWSCAYDKLSLGGAFMFSPVTVECSLYDGQVLPCSANKYEPDGEAPNGNCTSSCPPDRPISSPGSTSLSSCMTVGSNFLLSSIATDRLMELNIEASDFSLATLQGTGIEGGDLRSPTGVACVSEILCLVGNFVASSVVAVNLRGEVMGVFAQVAKPIGLLHIKNLNLLAVASGTISKVFLFDLADLNLEQPLQVRAPLPPTHPARPTAHPFSTPAGKRRHPDDRRIGRRLHRGGAA